MDNEYDSSKYYDLEFYKSLKDEEAFKERVNQGRLPIIDIAGHPFFADVRLDILRPMDNFQTMGLDLKNGGYYDPETDLQLFYYHVPSMTEAIINSDITELPKDVVLIKVPNQYVLDPVAMARKDGLEPEGYLERYPLVMYSKAEIIPLEESYLAVVVKENLEKRKQTRKNKPNKSFKSAKKSRGV